jgi:hypothetical protein
VASFLSNESDTADMKGISGRKTTGLTQGSPPHLLSKSGWTPVWTQGLASWDVGSGQHWIATVRNDLDFDWQDHWFEIKVTVNISSAKLSVRGGGSLLKINYEFLVVLVNKSIGGSMANYCLFLICALMTFSRKSVSIFNSVQ